MVEDLGSTIGEGFETWKKNLIICLPFVFNAVLTGIVASIIIGGGILASIPSAVPYFERLDGITYDEFLLLIPELLQSLGIIIIAVIVTIILVMLIDAFFWAGAIGMAKEAAETGATNLAHMLEYGKRKYISLFFTKLIIGLISLIGIIFLIPGISYILPRLSVLSELPEAEVVTALALFGFGFLAMTVYLMLISILFALPSYVVVLDDVGAVRGIKNGFRSFMDNKLAVFLLWLVIFAVTAIAGSFGAIKYVGGVISMLLFLVVVHPLTALWWSRLYLSMRETTEE